METLQLKDKIKGLIFGQAIGDALGLGSEFMTKEEVCKHYPNRLTNYDQIIQDRHRSRWKKGSWTDDTDQFLCIFDSFLEKGITDYHDIANNFYKWYKDYPVGIGSTTQRILSLPQYTLYPVKAAKLIWTMRRKNIAPNGSLMRNSIVSVWNYNNLEQALIESEEICKLTHYDPRCRDACKAMTYILHCELNNKTFLFENLIEKKIITDKRTVLYLQKVNGYSLQDLDLDNPTNLGYTLKALSSGLWVYENATSFIDGVLDIINAGGDADTNGAISGSILGAQYGFNSIPNYLINGLIEKDKLLAKTERIFKLLKIE